MRRSLRDAAVGAVAMVIAMIPSQLSAQSGSAAVNSTMSTYLAGGNAYSIVPANGGGIAPFEIILAAGTGRILRVDASGTATFCPNATCGTPNPDGPSIGGTNLNSSGVISGILAPTSGFLAGVFLGPSLPGAAPARLDFNAITTTFTSLNGLLLGQTFFIGDGFAGAVQQQFFVPDGATRLYFGIADGGGFGGDPDFYSDNVGTYTARYSITAATSVPEPSTIALMAAGLAALVAVRRRKTA